MSQSTAQGSKLTKAVYKNVPVTLSHAFIHLTIEHSLIFLTLLCYIQEHLISTNIMAVTFIVVGSQSTEKNP